MAIKTALLSGKDKTFFFFFFSNNNLQH